jgi:hypothetical protein
MIVQSEPHDDCAIGLADQPGLASCNSRVFDFSAAHSRAQAGRAAGRALAGGIPRFRARDSQSGVFLHSQEELQENHKNSGRREKANGVPSKDE